MQCRSKKRRRSPSSLDDDAVDLSGEDDMRGSASDHQQLNAPESPRPESEHGQQTLNNLEAFTLPDVFFSVAEFLMPFDHLSSSQVCKGWFQLLTEQRWLVKARVYFRQWVPYWTHQQNEVGFIFLLSLHAVVDTFVAICG